MNCSICAMLLLSIAPFHLTWTPCHCHCLPLYLLIHWRYLHVNNYRISTRTKYLVTIGLSELLQIHSTWASLYRAAVFVYVRFVLYCNAFIAVAVNYVTAFLSAEMAVIGNLGNAQDSKCDWWGHCFTLELMILHLAADSLSTLVAGQNWHGLWKYDWYLHLFSLRAVSSYCSFSASCKCKWVDTNTDAIGPCECVCVR